MKNLTTTLMILLILGFISTSMSLSAKKVRDWKTASTLWCEPIESTKQNPIQRVQAEYWIQNENLPENCLLYDMCGSEKNSICGSCYEDTIYFEAKFDDISQLRNMAYHRNLYGNTIYKIESSKKTGRTRFLGFKTQYLLDVNDWEFYPLDRLTIYPGLYSWKETGILGSPIDSSINRETLILNQTRWAKNYNGALEKKKYQCKTIEEEEIDSAIIRFKEGRKIYNEEMRKKDKLKRLEQDKKNKI